MDFGDIMKNLLPQDFTESLKNGVEKIANKLEQLDKDIQDIKAKLELKQNKGK